MVSNFARIGEEQALLAFPILKESLPLWEGKHRGRVLNGFMNVLHATPSVTVEIRMIAEDYLDDSKGVVKKAAKTVVKAIDKAK